MRTSAAVDLRPPLSLFLCLPCDAELELLSRPGKLLFSVKLDDTCGGRWWCGFSGLLSGLALPLLAALIGLKAGIVLTSRLFYKGGNVSC